MNLWRSYSTMEEFEREEIRPSFRIGFSLDDIDDSAFEGEVSIEERDAFQLDADDQEDEDSDEESELDDVDED